jgi:hypothetical protein
MRRRETGVHSTITRRAKRVREQAPDLAEQFDRGDNEEGRRRRSRRSRVVRLLICGTRQLTTAIVLWGARRVSSSSIASRTRAFSSFGLGITAGASSGFCDCFKRVAPPHPRGERG